jgi:hypothetical protein
MFGSIKNYFMGSMAAPVVQPSLGNYSNSVKEFYTLYSSGQLTIANINSFISKMNFGKLSGITNYNDLRGSIVFQTIVKLDYGYFYDTFSNRGMFQYKNNGQLKVKNDMIALRNFLNQMTAYRAYLVQKQAQDSAAQVASKKAIEELRLQNAAALAQADVERSAWLKEKIALEQAILKAKLSRETDRAEREALLKSQELAKVAADVEADNKKKKNKKLAIGGAVAAVTALMLNSSGYG